MVSNIARTQSITLHSATELQWMTVFAEKNDDTLAFNKHLYSRDRVTAHVPEWAMSILRLRPSDRTLQQCLQVHALLRGLRAFDKFTHEIQMALCRAFHIEKVEQGRVVLKCGHVGINFYFIYSGSVFVNQEDVTKTGEKFVRTVAVLNRGDAFGELALLQDIRRTATVTVREGCELLVVEKDVFASVCPQMFERELAEKQRFMLSLDLLSPMFWGPDAIRSLSMNAQIQEYNINKVIVANSSTENWIYVCIEGKCQVIRSLSLDRPMTDVDGQRRDSEVVLSNEILQLLANAQGQEGTSSNESGDVKNDLLSSLGLDYVDAKKGHKLYLNEPISGGPKPTEATTLTAFIQNQRETEDKEVVFLNVGEIEAGQVFDLPSLLESQDTQTSASTSTLMLVSAGARIMKIKKAAFFDLASARALDNIRTIISKQHNPTEESILDSYKRKVAWEGFKSDAVYKILQNKERRYQPTFRSNSNVTELVLNRSKKEDDNVLQNSSSKIISALRRQQTISESEPQWGGCSEPLGFDDEVENDDIKSGPLLIRRKSNCFDEIEPVDKPEVIIIHRQPSSVRQDVRIQKQSDIVQKSTPLPRLAKRKGNKEQSQKRI